MSTLDAMRSQANSARNALSDAAESTIAAAPGVVAATRDEVRRDVPQVRGHARELVEVLMSGVEERIAERHPIVGDTLAQLAHGGGALVATVPNATNVDRYVRNRARLAKESANHRAGQRSPRADSPKRRRRRITLVIVGIGLGAIVYRAVKLRRRAQSTGSSTSSVTGVSHDSDSGAYYSTSSDSRSAGGVYHDQEACPAGQRILPEHRMKGTDGRNRCKECQGHAR